MIDVAQPGSSCSNCCFRSSQSCHYLAPLELVHFIDRHAAFESVPQIPGSLGIGYRQLGSNGIAVGLFIRPPQIFLLAAKTETADFESAKCFLERLLEGSTDRHCLTNAFHLRHQRGIGFREFLERETRDFGDDVIDRRFETSLGLACNVVR